MKLFLFALLNSLIVQQADPLETYRWKNRLIVIVSGGDEGMATNQYDQFARDIYELEDRNIVVIRVSANEVRLFDDLTEMSGELICRGSGLSERTFGVALIGKDGGVKYRWEELVDPTEIFALIDQMPMRRSEMRSGNN